jgi:PAS domain S-box-containing protein
MHDTSAYNEKIKALEQENALLKQQLYALKSEDPSNSDNLSDKSYAQIFDSLVDEVHVWKIIKNEDDTIVNWELVDINASALKSWNKSRTDVVGKTAYDIFGEIAIKEFKPLVQQIFTTGQPYRWVRYFEATSQYLSMDSIPFKEHFISTGKDITELINTQKFLEDSQKQLNSIFNATSEAILIYDKKKRKILDCNEATLKIYGYSSKDEILNKDVAALSSLVENYNVDDIEVREQEVAQKGALVFEWLAKKKNGKHFWVEVSLRLTNLYNEDTYLAVVRDIHDKKQADLKLKQSQDNLNQIYNGISESIAIHDIDTVELIDCNDATLELYGVSTKEELLSYEVGTFSALEQGYDLDKLRAETKKAVLDGIYTFEWLSKRKNGEYFWVEVSMKPITLNGKKRLLAVSRDVTTRKEVEQAFKESEEKYRSLAENTADALMVCNHDFIIEYVSPSYHKIFGYSSEEKIGNSIIDLAHLIHPDDREVVLKSNERVLADKLESYTFQYRLKHKKGHYIWVRDQIKYIYNESGYFIKCYIVSSDLTTLKESEEKFRSLAENTADALLIYNKDYIIEYVSPAYAKLFGYTVEEKLGNTRADVAEFMHPDDREEVFNGITTAIANQAETHTYQFRFKHKKGHYIWVRNRAKFIYDDHGNYFKGYIVCSDINQLKQTEEELKQSNATKDKFFSIIGHDLKGPFNNIVGITDLLENDFNTFSIEDLKSIFSNLNSSTKNTLVLLDNLLDWYKSEKTKIHYKPTQLELNTIIEKVINLLKPIAGKKEISIKYTSSKPINIKADKNMLNSILRNLLSNAIKFTDKKGKITIGVKQEKACIRISVKDTGVGMDQETIDNLFQLTTTTSKRGTAREKGTGLGLMICKGFIEEHGGTLHVQSKLEHGSTFSFTIPVVEQDTYTS